MITEQDLREAIAECEGERNPNANTCFKLAAYHVIMDHMQKDDGGVRSEQYSFAAAPSPTPGREIIEYDSDTEFAESIRGMDIYDLLPIMDELMTALQVLNPRLYRSVLRKVAE